MKTLITLEAVGLCVAAILTLFVSLRYSEGARTKHAILRMPDGNKHIFFAVISILLFIAWASRFARDWISSTENDRARDLVTGYITEQKESDVPEVVALSAAPSKSDYILTVKNVGKKPASKVCLIFSDKSTPSAFACNPVPCADKIPSGTEFNFSMNLFWGINELLKLPNSVPGYREALQASCERFNAGETAFTPRFYLEYYDGEKKLTSPTYYLFLDKRLGVSHFGED